MQNGIEDIKERDCERLVELEVKRESTRWQIGVSKVLYTGYFSYRHFFENFSIYDG